MTKIAYSSIPPNPNQSKTLNTSNKVLMFGYQGVNQKIRLSNVKTRKRGDFLVLLNKGMSQNNIIVTFRVKFKRLC